MTEARDLALARQRTYGVMVETAKAWAAEKQVSPWGPMYRLVTAGVAGAAGITFGDNPGPVSDAWTAACRSFLDRVTTDGSITGDVAELDATVPVTADHEARARDIIDHWDLMLFVADLAAEALALAQSIPVGGASTSRGQVWLDDMPGTSPADKLRRAWAGGDRREIRPAHNVTIDAGTTPILVPPGAALNVSDTPQMEFSDQGRVNVRHTGGSAVFRLPDRGTNYSGTKGWSFVNAGFEGTSSVRLFESNPMDASGKYLAYAQIVGSSFDNFYTLIESPILGCVIDWEYVNNIAGPFAFHFAGSDNSICGDGSGKMDWGGGNTQANRTALLWFSSLEKTSVGSVYLTCQASTGIRVDGSDTRRGVRVYGATIEGRNADQECAGALVRQLGGGISFYGVDLNYAMANPAATGRDDAGYLDCSGGRMLLDDPTFRRGNSANGKAAALAVQRGSGRIVLRDGEIVGSATLPTVTKK